MANFVVLSTASGLNTDTATNTFNFDANSGFQLGAATDPAALMAGANWTNTYAPKISVSMNVTMTIQGVISDISGQAGALQKDGVGKLILRGANTYTGNTFVASGTLEGNAASIRGNVLIGAMDTNTSALVMNQDSDATFGGSIAGKGTLEKSGAGVLTLTGALTYTNTTTVSGGSLVVTNATRVASITTNTVAVSGLASTTAGTVDLLPGPLANLGSYGTPSVVGLAPTQSATLTNSPNLKLVIVGKITPTISVAPTASSITYGQTLASSMLSGGTASVLGSFAFTAPATVPNAGTVSQVVTFTPADATNYNTTSTTASVTVNPANLSSSDIALVPAGDGSYTASATGVSSFTYSYAGRNQTSYGPSATAPTAAGFYTVTASANGNYSGSNSANFSITGPMAIADSLTKPADNEPYLIPVSDLLANDFRITNTSGATVTSGLTVSAVTSGAGNTATLVGKFVQFTPSSGASDTFTYTVTDGSQTATATVTVTTEAQAPTFNLQIVKVETAIFAGGNTTVRHDFIAVPNQTYLVEYATDLNGAWTSAGNHSTGTTGSFSVTFTKSGDIAADWNAHMFFRASLVR
jgi:autotransporter-associated beta strand protein